MLLLFGPIFIVIFLVPVVGFALVMSPLVALICALLARRRGFSALHYGAAGAAYTLLFFFPGAYFMAQLLHWRVHRFFVAVVYSLLYGAWVLGLLGTVAIFFVITGTTNIVMAALVLIFFTMIVVSGWLLLQKYDADNAHRQQDAHVKIWPPQSLFLGRVYLMPFLGAYICFVLIALFFLDISPLSRFVFDDTTPPWER